MKSSKSKTPQLRVTERKTSDLIGYVLNAKDHPPEQVAALAGIIREVGFRSPIAIDEAGVIIAGHGRLLAAQKLGMTEVPCIVHADLTEREKRILRIADNKLAEMAVVNQGNLSEELRDLAAMGEDFVLTGYTQADVDALTAAANAMDCEVIGATEVGKDERAGSSPWDRVQASDSVRCVIGDVEFGIPKDLAERFAEECKSLAPVMREGAAKWFADHLSQS